MKLIGRLFYTPFEPTKYLCTLKDGRRVLWKYAGLAMTRRGMMTEAEKMVMDSLGDLVPRCLGSRYGFCAQEWIEGKQLRQCDATPHLLGHVGHYIARAAGDLLSPVERRAAVDRLREMLEVNTRELFDEAMADRVRTWTNALGDELYTPTRTYGDGRLSPHEWILTPDARIVKTDCAGHDTDHTVVGRQSVAWDIAGALIEWNLDEGGASHLLNAVYSAGIEPIPPRILNFYRAAYAAFRAGLSAMCAGMTPHAAEQNRLQSADHVTVTVSLLP